MYSMHMYGAMILDRGRTEAYAQAIRARVKPGAVVVDLGCGPGIWTLLACQAGARKVYAIDCDAVIEVAREAVAANSYTDRVDFIRALSTEVSLPEKADVIVSEIHGVMPCFDGCVSSILDARDRFMKPGGSLIPELETMRVTLLRNPVAYGRIVNSWQDCRGFDYQSGFKRAVNEWSSDRFARDTMLVEPQTWATFDYANLQSVNARGTAEWTIGQASEAHGLGVWFDCVTTAGVGFSNAPTTEEDEHVFSRGFFPWPKACRLETGDRVSVELRADRAGEDYVWGWNTEIRSATSAHRIKQSFRQSTFLSARMSADSLRKSASNFVPSPNTEAAIDKMILELLYAGITLEEISRRVAEGFPQRFPEWRKALTRVGELSLRYSA